MRSDLRAPEGLRWVGSNDTFLAHLAGKPRLRSDLEMDFAICGVEMWEPSKKKAEGRPRCSMCPDIAEGKAEAF